MITLGFKIRRQIRQMHKQEACWQNRGLRVKKLGTYLNFSECCCLPRCFGLKLRYFEICDFHFSCLLQEQPVHSKILYPTQRVHHLATCMLYAASLGFLFQWPVREHKNVDKLTCYCSKYLAFGQSMQLKANDIAKLRVLVLKNGLMQKARSGWSKFML